MAYYRSFSAVKSLRECGEAYRLQRIEHVSQRPMAAGVAGRIIHSASEMVDLEITAGELDEATLKRIGHARAAEVFDEEMARETTDEYPPEAWKIFGKSKNNPHGQDMEWFRKTGVPGSISNYIDWRLDNPQLEVMTLPTGVLAIEVPFEIVLGPGMAPIKGVIDRVFTNVNNDLNLIVDLKSGLKPKTSEQLGLYRQALLAGLPGSQFDYGAYLYGMKPGSKTGIRITADINLKFWTPERLARIYGQADKQIEAGIYLPNPGDACFMCSVSKHCAFYQASVL